jgi:prepilin-type N-terminal cleavage/methylation domain-containing protein
MTASRRPIRRERGQAGFSMIETMIVIAIIGIIVNLAVPIYLESRMRAEVASILGDYNAVRAAVADYYLANQEWPAGSDPGEAPGELVAYLGGGMNWAAPYTYDFDYFADEGGNPTQPEAGVLVGFSVRNIDDRMVSLIQGAAPGMTTVTWGNGVTFILVGTGSESGSGPTEPEGEPGDADEGTSEEDDGAGRGRGRGRGLG